jgi:hypothetical protein
MHGAASPLFLAGFVFPGAWQCFVWAAPPFLVVAAAWWLINRTDRIVSYLFPDLEWEKSLGWLNIRAERRSKAALRWIGYGVHAMLAVALYGIVWAAEGLQALDDWPDPWGIGDLALRILTLGVCLGMWLLYLGCWLIPKLRAEREEAGLKRFRAEAEEAEKEREKHPRSRIQSPLRKPRVNAPQAPLVPDRTRRRRQAGG